MTVWKAVVGYEGLYEVSDDGQVRSIARQGTEGLVKKTFVNHKGYVNAMLWKENRQRGFYVHVLMMRAFVGPRPEGYETRHLNNDKTDNRLPNLLYGTPAENNDDRREAKVGPYRDKPICPNGHARTDENLYVYDGKKRCRTCRNDAAKRYREKVR